MVQAKMFAALDVRTNGRIICGVGVRWPEREFEILGVPYAQRGPVTGEILRTGIDQLTDDFRVDSLDDSIRVMEHPAVQMLPFARRLG